MIPISAITRFDCSKALSFLIIFYRVQRIWFAAHQIVMALALLPACPVYAYAFSKYFPYHLSLFLGDLNHYVQPFLLSFQGSMFSTPFIYNEKIKSPVTLGA